MGFLPNYLSDLLKKETNHTAYNQIHLFFIEGAKTTFLNSDEAISQISYELGFGYSQHFSGIFKARTGMTPKEFRNPN